MLYGFAMFPPDVIITVLYAHDKIIICTEKNSNSTAGIDTLSIKGR